MTTQPKAVLISDVHYNLSTLPLADAAMKTAIAKAEELSVPVIVAGDLHDTKASLRGECVSAIMNTISSSKQPVIVLIGNHDMINEKGSEHSLAFLKPICEVIDVPKYHPELDIYFIPYQNDLQKLKNLIERIPDFSTIIMHQGLLGANMGHYVQDKISLPKDVFSKVRVISGHYHQSQTFVCGKEIGRNNAGTFSYIGNPYTLSFGEAFDGPKGIRVLHTDGSLEFVPTKLRRHVKVETHADLIKSLSPIVDKFSLNDLILVRVSGPESQLQTITKTDIAKYLGVEQFKLELCPDAAEVTSQARPIKQSAQELFDSLIDAEPETDVQKAYLKQLWRDSV